MTELDAVLDTYRASANSLDIVSELITKSRKGTLFHGTVFFGLTLEEARSLLAQSRKELDDLTIVSLVSVFERILFDHPASPLQKKLTSRSGGLNDAIKLFKGHVSNRVYEDTEQLCGYRDWVAHGKRWNEPPHADPISAHKQLAQFLSLARLSTKG